MKRFFPQYRYELLKNASPFGYPVNFNLEDFRRRLTEMSMDYPSKVRDFDTENVFCIAAAEHALYFGRGDHIFVDEDSEQVILNAIRKIDNKALAGFRPVADIGIIYRVKNPPILYNYAAEDLKSAAIQVESLGILRVDNLSEQDWSTTHPAHDPNLLKLRDAMRFVNGCFMMRECFPQVFQDGLPGYVKHPAWFKNQDNKSISIARVSHEVCPHIRVGHFRLLSSERFTHKRGQVVFVKPSMVKGHATHTEKGETHATNE